MMNRRQLLQVLAALPLSALSTRLLASPEPQRKFLLVFLRGAYDAASLLVPVSSDFYYQARPGIAIPRPGSAPFAALPLEPDWGLHPALQKTLLPLYQNRQLAFVPFAGTDDLSRSHFETQDSIELGQALNSPHHDHSGFMNRLASVLHGSHPMSFTDQLPLVFSGQIQVPNMALHRLGKPVVDARQSTLITDMYRGSHLAPALRAGFELRDQVNREMREEMAAANRDVLSSKGFEQEARRIAILMRDRFNLGFVDIGGWDTHVGQGGSSGYLASRLEELGRGLAAYAETMGPAWQDTVVVVISEFGRTFRENGDRGTDHGHGSTYWILGGKLNGGRIAGEQIRLTPTTLFQNRDYPVLNNYRSLLAGLLSRHFDLSHSQIKQVFPGAKPTDFGLL
jgi:uncharacterized protein (DUF1501 family)